MALIFQPSNPHFQDNTQIMGGICLPACFVIEDVKHLKVKDRLP